MSLQDAVGIGPYDTTTDSAKVGRLGALVEPFGDGRLFRLSKSSAAIDRNKMLANAAAVAGNADLAVAAAAIGANKITVTNGATVITANQYAHGYVHVVDGPGEGQSFRIRNHPGIAGTAAGVITIHDTVRVALTSASVVTIQYHECVDLVMAPADGIDAPMGVCLVAVAAADTYFLAQVAGRVLCLATGTWVQGDPLSVVSTIGALGATAEAGSGAYDRVDAIAVQAAATTQYGICELRLGY